MQVDEVLKNKPLLKFAGWTLLSLALVAGLGIIGIIVLAILCAITVYLKKPSLDLKKPFPGGVVLGGVVGLILWLAFGRPWF